MFVPRKITFKVYSKTT